VIGQVEREEDPLGERGEHAVGDPQMAVGLGQHERQAQAPGGQARRRRHVAAPAHHDVRLNRPQDPARAAGGAAGPEQRAGGLQRVAAVEPGDPQRMERVARARDELRLGALAAEEMDLGALIP